MSGLTSLGWLTLPSPARGNRRARFCETSDFGALSQQLAANLLPILGSELGPQPIFIKSTMCVSTPGVVVKIEVITPSRLGLKLEADSFYWPAIADALDDLCNESGVAGGPVISGFMRRADGDKRRSVDVHLRSSDVWMMFEVTQAKPISYRLSRSVSGKLRDAQ